LAGDDPRHHVLHTEWNGNQWSAPMPIFTTNGVPEWERIALGSGNQLHAIWFERPAGFEWKTTGGNYAIWYARGTSGAPAIEPIVFATPAARRISGAQAWRVLQTVLAILTVAAVIIATRRRGW
jgi:hypothetical protein